MTVQEALNQLKLLDQRISSVDLKKLYSYVEDTKPEHRLQQMQDLITRREDLQYKIQQSNIVTTVTVAGMTMSVAEAIIKKATYQNYGYRLLQAVKSQLEQQENAKSNQKHEQDKIINNLRDTAIANGTQFDEAAIRATLETPLKTSVNLKTLYTVEQEEFENFMAEVDTALTVSNVLTQLPA